MKRRREVETCAVADQFCTSPANGDPTTRARGVCYACGLAVCAMCSSRRQYRPYGVQRVCNGCQAQILDGGSDHVVMRRLHRLAGVPPPPRSYVIQIDGGYPSKKRVFVRQHTGPQLARFPNREAARQYIRNHLLSGGNPKIIEASL